jgi:hypothetical protein
MKTIATSLLGLIIFSQISIGQQSMTLKGWTFLSESNVTVLFARNQSNVNYMIIPVESYFNAVENQLFKNKNRMSLMDDLNIEYLYDEYLFNEAIGNVYLVFDEHVLRTSYGDDLRKGEKLCPNNCLMEILFCESLKLKPEFVIMDNDYLSDIKSNVLNPLHQNGIGEDSTVVIIEKGFKVKMENNNKGSKRWLSYQLNYPCMVDYITSEPINLETRIKIKKLPKMYSYKSTSSGDDSEQNEIVPQLSQK